ncbi:hypothetical protein A4A49_32376 [Nicotiana attenuata]|uniref:Uncharacterized protein n=1 Tax=Nicotiana attenuata TaxID=49451 RepID=A0A1J6IDX1_NICAT|nr:hypothetical protein A4A49_32376 [Nicotiana attenuata]
MLLRHVCGLFITWTVYHESGRIYVFPATPCLCPFYCSICSLALIVISDVAVKPAGKSKSSSPSLRHCFLPCFPATFLMIFSIV